MHEGEREGERGREHLHFIPRGFFFERRIPLTLKGTSRGSSSSSSRISPSKPYVKLRNAILESLPFEIFNPILVEIVLRSDRGRVFFFFQKQSISCVWIPRAPGEHLRIGVCLLGEDRMFILLKVYKQIRVCAFFRFPCNETSGHTALELIDLILWRFFFNSNWYVAIDIFVSFGNDLSLIRRSQIEQWIWIMGIF